MEKSFKIGDKVILDKEEILKYHNYLPSWYSEDIYTVVDTYNNGELMIVLDRNLPHDNPKRIFFNYLKLSLKEERKNKLLKLNNV